MDNTTLRDMIYDYVSDAVIYGNVNKEWANTWLARLGANTLQGKNEYRLNVPIVGVYGRRVTASSRAEALKLFNEHVERVAAAGKITADGSYDNVYHVTFPNAGAASQPEFFSGPEDPDTETPELTGDELKAQIRAMLREGVAEQGWDHSYANRALENMGLEPLPALVKKMVDVPVMGTATIGVRVFEGDDPNAVAEAAVARLRRYPKAVVSVVEVGEVGVSVQA